MRSLVIDTDAAIQLADRDRFDALARTYALHAPRMLWSEACSVLHRAMHRRRSTDGYELVLYERIVDSPVVLVDDYDRSAPWDIASLLGWHKTCDAEFLAAARHVGAGIFTFDQQLASGANRLGVPVIVPD